jgi:hypothetical protein
MLIRMVVAAVVIFAGLGCHESGKGTRANSNGSASAGGKPPAVEPRSRQAFAACYLQIKKGMPADDAERLLGKPDDIRTQRDPGGISFTNTREIWGYGTDRHLGFATLGSIAIDDEGRVQYLSGTTGAKDLVARMGESELRRILRMLAETSPLEGGDFRPLHTIAAVNALQPLGKQVGVAVLREYMAVSFNSRWAEDDGLFAVMRVLFEVPPADRRAETRRAEDWPRVVYPGYFRPPALGGPSWSPNDLMKFPLFPLMVVDDVPLVLVGGYMLGGMPESPGEHLDELERNANWRQRPLRPTDNPLGILPKVVAQLPDYERSDDSRGRILMQQLLSLTDTVVRTSRDEGDGCYATWDQAKASFDAAAARVQELNIRWDVRKCCYVRGDGTALPPEIRPLYQRDIFEPAIKAGRDFRMRVVLERMNSKFIAIGVEIHSEGGKQVATSIRVMQLGDREKILVDDPKLEVAGSDGSVSSTLTATNGNSSFVATSYRRRLPAGQRVRIEVTHGDAHFGSAIFEP